MDYAGKLAKERNEYAEDLQRVESALHDLTTLLGLRNIIKRALKNPSPHETHKALRDIRKIVVGRSGGDDHG